MAGCGVGEGQDVTPRIDPVPSKPAAGLDANGEEKPALRLTAKAVEMVKQVMENEKLEGYGLRIAMVGGGCSGMQPTLDLSKEVGPLDTVLEQDGVKMYVDMMSMGYLVGATIDYVESDHGAGFKFDVPLAQRSCGCGQSYGF